MDVPGYARYKPIEVSYELKKLEQPGVYVVKVTDQRHLQATMMALTSDIEAIVKTSREHVLIFAQDMKTGKERPSASPGIRCRSRGARGRDRTRWGVAARLASTA